VANLFAANLNNGDDPPTNVNLGLRQRRRNTTSSSTTITATNNQSSFICESPTTRTNQTIIDSEHRRVENETLDSTPIHRNSFATAAVEGGRSNQAARYHNNDNNVPSRPIPTQPTSQSTPIS